MFKSFDQDSFCWFNTEDNLALTQICINFMNTFNCIENFNLNWTGTFQIEVYGRPSPI